MKKLTDPAPKKFPATELILKRIKHWGYNYDKFLLVRKVLD